MLYWVLKTIVLGPVLRLLFRPWVEGEENVPEQGPAILASNHLSFSDSIFLPLMLQRRITFPAKMEYFTGTGLSGRLKRIFFAGTGQIPIDRAGGSAAAAALKAGLEVLHRDELFGIYPEGTRSPDGRLYRGKTGVARLALEANVPIIPVAMIDTDKAQPTGQKIPTITRIGIRFGSPINVSDYVGRGDEREVMRAITDDVMRSLQALSGREYVEEYAAARKSQLAERASALMAAARAESAAAALRAEELVASARSETAAVAAKAEELMAIARAETTNAAARGHEFVAAARAKAEGSAAAVKAEEFVAAARAKNRARRAESALDLASAERDASTASVSTATASTDSTVATAHSDALEPGNIETGSGYDTGSGIETRSRIETGSGIETDIPSDDAARRPAGRAD